MVRSIQPEILDSLPAEHPAALHNRRDLRIVNALMGNSRWVLRTLRAHVRPGDRVLEIGAGLGELGQRLSAAGLRADGLDRWPRPPAWPSTLAWHQSDAHEFSAFDHYSVFVGNLIFHQFNSDELARLGARLRESGRLIIACEPARRRFSQVAYTLAAPLLGFNRVSRHDGHVSIAAGFVAEELPQLLGLQRPDWHLACTTTPRGAYHLVACRRR